MRRRTFVVVGEYDPYGGPYKNLLRIIRALLSQGHEVHVFPCAPVLEELQRLSESGPRIHLHHDYVSPLRGPNLARPIVYFLEAFRFNRWLKAHHLEAATVIFSITSPGRFLFRYIGSVLPIYIFRSYPEGLKHRIAGKYFRTLASPNARFLGVSRFTAREIARVWGLDPSDPRFGVFPNTAGSEGLPKPRWTEGHSQVLMVGRLHPDKNPILWLDVAACVLKKSEQPIRFVWLGSGPLVHKSKQYARELGISDAVEFSGFQTDPYPAYEHSNLYLHLARIEPMSNALLDATALGIPAIVSDAGGNSEIVKDKETGIVVKTSVPEKIAESVLKVLSDPRLHRQYSRNAVSHYQTNFSSVAWNRRLMELCGL